MSKAPWLPPGPPGDRFPGPDYRRWPNEPPGWRHPWLPVDRYASTAGDDDTFKLDNPPRVHSMGGLVTLSEGSWGSDWVTPEGTREGRKEPDRYDGPPLFPPGSPGYGQPPPGGGVCEIVAPVGSRKGAILYPGAGVPGNPALVFFRESRRGMASRVRPWEPKGFPEYEARSGIQHGFPALLLRAPSLNSAHANLRTALVGPHARNHHFSPTTLRFEAFGNQRATGEFSYTQRPGKGRYEGGTSNGGAWFLPPETSIDDHGTGFAPPGRTTSTTYVGFAPGVFLGFGVPVPSTGGMKTGYRASVTTAGALTWQHVDGAGATTSVFGLDASKQVQVRETGGQLLTLGAVADGEVLTRDGTGIDGKPISALALSVLHREVADQTVGNTTTETSVVNAGAGLSIPANTLSTNRVVELMIEGTYLNNTGVNRNLTVRVYYGTTEMIEFAVANIATSGNVRSFGFKARLFGDGATNTQEATLEMLMSPAGAPATGLGGFGPGASGRVKGTAAEDSTGALDLDVTVEHSTNDPSLTLTVNKVFAVIV